MLLGKKIWLLMLFGFGAGLLAVVAFVMFVLMYSDSLSFERDDISPVYVPFVLEEVRHPHQSTSNVWWLDSGGQVTLDAGRIETIHGNLPLSSTWHRVYAASNPVDTDNGYHPQNVLRLVTQESYGDFREEVYAKVTSINISPSPNRNASNGILLMGRYADHNNLYYSGIRVDGNAVIKKKRNGVYETLAITPIFGAFSYHRSRNPNIIPLDIWIGIRTDIMDQSDGSVLIKLFVDKGRTGTWQQVLEARDYGVRFPVLNKGRAGLRSDFMDVIFDSHIVSNI